MAHRQEGKGITEISGILGVSMNTLRGWFYRGKKPRSMWTEEEKQSLSSKLSSQKMGDLNPMWKGDECTLRTAYERAQRWYGHLVPDGHEIHHIDGNPWNNKRENIEFVKRREHMIKDGRMENLRRN